MSEHHTFAETDNPMPCNDLLQDRAAVALAYLTPKDDMVGTGYAVARGAPEWVRDLLASVHDVNGDGIMPWDRFKTRFLGESLHALVLAMGNVEDAAERLPPETDRTTLLAWWASTPKREAVYVTTALLPLIEALWWGWRREAYATLIATARWLLDAWSGGPVTDQGEDLRTLSRLMTVAAENPTETNLVAVWNVLLNLRPAKS